MGSVQSEIICPRCGGDFMYHNTDTYLHRTVAWDADTKEPCSFETICQNCNDIETVSDYILEKSEHRGLDNAIYMASNTFGAEKTEKAIEYLGFK
jgi:hypothetical protein